jgi:hypothetical protein
MSEQDQEVWCSIREKASLYFVSEATIRRAIARGLKARKIGKATQVLKFQDLPPVAKTGPSNFWEVREPGGCAWWQGSTLAEARKQLVLAYRAGLKAARLLKNGQWFDSIPYRSHDKTETE